MSKRRDADYLLDLQEAIHRIGVYIADMTYEQFMEDIKTQDAVVRNLEVMGGNFRVAGIGLFTFPQVTYTGLL